VLLVEIFGLTAFWGLNPELLDNVCNFGKASMNEEEG